jgi:Kef-type K+ transport system membrane component KefB
LTKFKLSKQAYDTLFNRCGLPAFIFLKNKGRAMKVGIGMVSKGEVGLIVAGVGVSSGALSAAIYTTVIIMVALTTIITPIWLKIAYREKEGKLD